MCLNINNCVVHTWEVVCFSLIHVFFLQCDSIAGLSCSNFEKCTCESSLSRTQCRRYWWPTLSQGLKIQWPSKVLCPWLWRQWPDITVSEFFRQQDNFLVSFQWHSKESGTLGTAHLCRSQVLSHSLIFYTKHVSIFLVIGELSAKHAMYSLELYILLSSYKTCVTHQGNSHRGDKKHFYFRYQGFPEQLTTT